MQNRTLLCNMDFAVSADIALTQNSGETIESNKNSRGSPPAPAHFLIFITFFHLPLSSPVFIFFGREDLSHETWKNFAAIHREASLLAIFISTDPVMILRLSDRRFVDSVRAAQISEHLQFGLMYESCASCDPKALKCEADWQMRNCRSSSSRGDCFGILRTISISLRASNEIPT